MEISMSEEIHSAQPGVAIACQFPPADTYFSISDKVKDGVWGPVIRLSSDYCDAFEAKSCEFYSRRSATFHTTGPCKKAVLAFLFGDHRCQISLHFSFPFYPGSCGVSG